MKQNIGSTDRVIRAVAAAAIGLLLVAGFITGVAGTILGVLSVILLATSAAGFCPLYLPIGISTQRDAARHAR